MAMLKDIHDTIVALCPRVFPDFAPIETVRPYVTWQMLGGPPLTFLEGTLPDKRWCLLQVNVWADTRKEADAIALQIDAAMRAATLFQASPTGDVVSDYDHDMGVRCARQDFTILGTR